MEQHSIIGTRCSLCSKTNTHFFFFFFLSPRVSLRALACSVSHALSFSFSSFCSHCVNTLTWYSCALFVLPKTNIYRPDGKLSNRFDDSVFFFFFSFFFCFSFFRLIHFVSRWIESCRFFVLLLCWVFNRTELCCVFVESMKRRRKKEKKNAKFISIELLSMHIDFGPFEFTECCRWNANEMKFFICQFYRKTKKENFHHRVQYFI